MFDTTRLLHCLPSTTRHCTSVLVGPAAVRRWSADETSRPAALIDLQSSRRPPVAACHCRRSLFCCCWPTTLERLSDDVQSAPSLANWTHIYFVNHTQTLFCSCVAIVVLEVTFTKQCLMSSSVMYLLTGNVIFLLESIFISVVICIIVLRNAIKNTWFGLTKACHPSYLITVSYKVTWYLYKD